MADNVSVTAGAGVSIGADEISSVKYQRVKLISGADGTNDGDIAKANGLPIQVSQPATKSALTEIAYGTLTGSFANLSVTGVSGAKRVSVWNDTNAAVYLSDDGGTTKHEVIPAKWRGEIALTSGTTALWGRYVTAPTEGTLYIRAET